MGCTEAEGRENSCGLNSFFFIEKHFCLLKVLGKESRGKDAKIHK